MGKRNSAYLYAVLAAVLFGASTPAAKLLLGKVDPWLLAGLLYLGSAIRLLVLFAIQVLLKKTAFKQASLRYKDWQWLGVATFFGGIVGPILLMVGLAKTPASSASLFLNFESVFTALIAWLAFKEHVDRKIALGMLFIVIGGVVLSWKGNLYGPHFLGPLLIAGACLCWALDNNFTRKISAANPLQIAMIKCLIAGLTNTMLAIIWGSLLPGFLIFFVAGAVGFIGYGLSLLFFIFGLRYIGAARTGAYFSLAPFAGAGLAIAFLGEAFSIQLVVASFFMGIGIWLHITERHSHEHQHEELVHDHRHVHDEHHQHEHLPSDPKGESHTHKHKHSPLYHTHPHYPDIHHRHGHSRKS